MEPENTSTPGATGAHDTIRSDTTKSSTPALRVRLELEAIRTGAWEDLDPAVRLRRLLKLALRSFGWRCVGAEVDR